MYEEDTGLGRVLESAALPAAPSAARAQAVHERMRELTRTPVRRQRRWPAVVASGLLVIGAGTFGVAGTETGRALVRYLFTKIEPAHGVTGTQPDGSSWSVVRHGPGAEPFSPAEAQAVTAQMDEIAATKQAGGGRLAQVIESPGHPSIPGAERIFTTYVIEYTLADGQTTSIGDNAPSPAQRANMRLDEIMRLHDAGAGEIVFQAPFPMGTGRYTIRFTSSDGQTVDVGTYYPPAPRAEREALFAELRQLKQDRRFVVLNASRDPEGRVSGMLRYTLSDGRSVGIAEEVPANVITPDGKYIAAPAGEEPVEIQNAAQQP